MQDDYSFSIFPFFDHDFSSQHSKWVALSTSSSPSSTPPPGQYSTFQPTKVKKKCNINRITYQSTNIEYIEYVEIYVTWLPVFYLIVPISQIAHIVLAILLLS